MDEWMFDTNILVALIQPGTPLFVEADRALQTLRQRNADLWIAPQTLSEFYATLTRPVRLNRNGLPANNSGLGKTSAEALQLVADAENSLALLDDHAGTFLAWKEIVTQTGAMGNDCFDMRLVAIMRVYNISNLLTFNVADFAAASGVHVVSPANL